MGAKAMIAVVAGLIVRDGYLLAARRPGGKHMAGRWEFPGGKLDRGESPEQALFRELREELDVSVTVGRIYHAQAHSYPEKDVLILFYPCRLLEGEPRAVEEAEVRWIKPEQIGDFDWAEADRPVAERLAMVGLNALI